MGTANDKPVNLMPLVVRRFSCVSVLLMYRFFLFVVIHMICCFPVLVRSISGSGGYEIDVSWDFTNQDYDGWANATSEEMGMEVVSINDELRCSIIQEYPNIDSPQLFLKLTSRHYIVMRMSYFGASSTAKFLLKSGTGVSGRSHRDHGRSYWSTKTTPSIIGSSISVNDTLYDKSNVVDNDMYTYFLSNSTSGTYIILDLHTSRWIKELRILPIGNENSPKRCLLQRSITTGSGPFETVKSFTIEGISTLTNYTQERVESNSIVNDDIIDIEASINATYRAKYSTISGFDGHARYWRLIVLDNYGGPNVGVREISLHGYDEEVAVIPFSISNTGSYNNYYIPMAQVMNGNLLRLRLEIQPEISSFLNARAGTTIRKWREGMNIDYIRIARAPEVYRVRGCLDRYYNEADMVIPLYNVTSIETKINENLPLRSFTKNTMDLPYATTYDCPITGNIDITVEGLNFGPAARIYIDSKECIRQSYAIGQDTTNARIEEIVCTIPSTTEPGPKLLRVENGILPGLYEDVPYFSYRNAPPVLSSPVFTNVGAYRIDLVWSPPGNEFDHMMTTGYKILWFEPKFPSRISNLTVGNVTTTSVRGLKPATEYVFAIAPIAEGAYHEQSASLPTDLYGRRNPVDGAMIGTFSPYTNVTATVLFDFDFGLFNANKTLNSSGSTESASLGATGMWGPEGAYGLVMVGSANVQNCNVSSTCCDGYNATIGLASCGNLPTVCAVLPSRALASDFVYGGITRRQVGSNIPYPNGAPQEIEIFTLDELIANKGAELPTSQCGPALRLTPSQARESGAAWYRRKMNVREGFDTTITFEISNPSQVCDRLDDVNTFCRSRGADGFAFVIQNVGNTALGLAGSGMGYSGIFNALAVEMDTYHNYDQMDFYENHIAVMTEGFRFNLTSNHSRALATSNRVPDLTEGRHTVRIKYSPNFDDKAVLHPSFQVNGYTTNFLENADYKNGGQGDWGSGFGLLYIYIDDLYSPIITTPINLDYTLKLDNGRAIVGLTAATGETRWQAHDILSWQFSSTYEDEVYNPPTIVNGEGAHACVDETECVHVPDYDHYMRINNVDTKYIMENVDY